MANEDDHHPEALAVEEPAAKKLRSSETDLTVILKYSVNTTEGDNAATSNDAESRRDDDNKQKTSKQAEVSEKKYPMHSQHLATLSKFVDTALSLPMVEQQTRSVTFTDVTPETFELAISLVENPLAIREMKAQQAAQVVEFYDKYEFPQGLKLCDHVIHEYIEKEGHYCPPTYVPDQHSYDASIPPQDLDFLVDVIALAENLNLEKSIASGIKYLKSRFGHLPRQDPYGQTIFSEEHIRKLLPFFRRGILRCGLEKEELESPLFPKYFVKTWSANRLQHTVRQVMVTNSGHKAVDGRYENNLIDYHPVDEEGDMVYREGRWDGEMLRFSIERNKDGDWVFIGVHYDEDTDDYTTVKTLWKCPHTRNFPYPPRTGWIEVGPLAHSKDLTVEPIDFFM